MESPFDYNAFKSQHALHNALRALSTVLQDSRNAENIQNFPTVPGQLPPFEQLLKNLKVDTGQVVEPEFNFEFIGITP